MIVTEAQAKKLWCPQAREVCEAGHGAANRGYRGKPLTLCIASACMLWRWAGYRSVPSGNDEAHGVCGLSHEAIALAQIEQETGGL